MVTVTSVPTSRPVHHASVGEGRYEVPDLLLVGTAAILGVAAAVVAAGAGSLDELVRGYSLFGAVGLVSYTVLGTIVVLKRPGHRMGRLLAGIAVAFGLSQFAAAWGSPSMPGAVYGYWVAGWIWLPAYWAVPTLLPMLFPDGRLPSRRWWPVLAAAVAGLVLSTVGWATVPHELADVPGTGTNPFGSPLGTWFLDIGGGLILAGIGGSLVALTVRFRRSGGVERQQIKWFLVAAAAAVGSFALAFALGTDAGPPVLAVGTAVLPTGITVGVLRYRLWDVDLVINRSLVYGLLTLAVVSVYIITVSLLGGLLGRRLGAPLVATGLVAVGVHPLRMRLQRWANELLYGDRHDPAAVLERLTTGLEAPSFDEAATAVGRALRLPAVAIESAAGVVHTGDAPPGPGSLRVPLIHRGEEVGALVAAPRAAGMPLDARDQRVLDGIARHLAVAVRAERLTVDLQRSREELVTAREEERRRLRRDLHDDLGPTLAAVAIQLDGAGQERCAATVRDAVRSVRTIVEDLRPPALDELGLVGALRDRMGLLPLPVDLDAGDLPRLSAATDVAVYRIVTEAVANVVAHANATRATVTLSTTSDELQLRITDDGIGSAAQRAGGVGIGSMRERAEELGGTFEIATAAGSGTTIRVKLPLHPARRPPEPT